MKDARYSRIKIGILMALAALALISFNLTKPAFEDRLAATRAERIATERDAEDVAAIKSDPQEFDRMMARAESEIAAGDRRLGLEPGETRAYVLDKAAGAGIPGEAVSITEGDETSLTPAVLERKYTVSARGGYDEGVAFMRGIEEGEAAWSVSSLVYDDGDDAADPGSWLIELSLLYEKRPE
jgi:hypothetical protein